MPAVGSLLVSVGCDESGRRAIRLRESFRSAVAMTPASVNPVNCPLRRASTSSSFCRALAPGRCAANCDWLPADASLLTGAACAPATSPSDKTVRLRIGGAQPIVS
eukprot:scaffold73125_cov63-Phaeocystis_antarctica.AAC.3